MTKFTSKAAMKLLNPVVLKRIRTVFRLIGLAVFDRLLLTLEKIFLSAATLEGYNEAHYVLIFNNRLDKRRQTKKLSQKERLLQKLHQIGLETEQINSSFWNEGDSEEISVYTVRSSYDALLHYAQEMDLKKPIRSTGMLVPFDASIRRKFAGYVPGDPNLFTSTEQQRITLFAMRTIRYDDGRDLVSVAQHNGILKQIFPLSDPCISRDLLWKWSTKPGDLSVTKQIADYFGTEIAFSFVWLAAYTRFLWIPALLGICIHLLAKDTADDIWSIIFAAIMPIFATIFLELWKRRSSRLQYQLGVHDLESFERPRPEYDPRPVRVPGTKWQISPRVRKQVVTIVSFPIAALLLLGTALAMLAQFRLQDYLKRTHPDSMAVHAPSVLFSILLPYLNGAYVKAATWITDLENHRTQTSYRTALLTRHIVLTCTSSFMSLFYLLFWVQDLGRVRQQLATLLISSQLIGQFKEIGLPAINGIARAVRSKKTAAELRRDRDRLRAGRRVSVDDRTGRRTIPAIEDESVREPFPNTDDDYSEMIVQFGYVFLFGWSWPLAALCALLNNLTEIRTDCFKLCIVMQKPESRSANGIGVWYYVLEMITVGSVLTNTAFMFLRICMGSGEGFLPGYSIGVKLAVLIVFEHVVLLAKFLLDWMIPDIPSDIRDQIHQQQVNFARDQTRQLKSKIA